MARYECTKYPSLIVGGLRLRFADGVLETKDEAQIKRLDSLVKDGRFGVTRVGGGSTQVIGEPVEPGQIEGQPAGETGPPLSEAEVVGEPVGDTDETGNPPVPESAIPGGAKSPTRAELVAEAESLGVKVPTNTNKAGVQELIDAAKAAGEPAGRDW